MDAPDGIRRKPYNGEIVKTANRVPIVEGLRVYTNNLDKGVITLKDAEFEWNSVEGRYVLWFKVILDTKYNGDSIEGWELQSDDRVTTVFEGVRA